MTVLDELDGPISEQVQVLCRLGSLPQDVHARRERAELYVRGDVVEELRVELVERREPPQEPGGLVCKPFVDHGRHGS